MRKVYWLVEFLLIPFAFLRVLCGKKDWFPTKGEEMPEGYYVPFSAIIDAPYWHYKFGQGPKANNSAGTIPKGGLIHVQGPAGAWGGTHQSAYLMGVGRIIVKIGDFQPAPALITNS